MINRLPDWCIVNKFPAFYDIESATAIEQTARIYGKMNELVDSYNSFAENITNTLNTFIGETEEEYETFKIAIRQEFQDFIDTIDLKILAIEKDIANFETSTNQKLNGFAADIAAFKTSITTAFTTFKSDVNTTLNGFESDIETFKSSVNTTLNGFESNIENFKNETNTALSQFENRVNATLQQMQDDLNEYIEMTKTVTGTNVISINENKNFMHNVIMSTTAPANTVVNIYNNNKNLAANDFKGTTATQYNKLPVELCVDDEGMPRLCSLNSVEIGNTVFSYGEFTYFVRQSTYITIGDPGNVMFSNINQQLEEGKTYICVAIYTFEEIPPSVEGASTTYKWTIGDVYLFEKTPDTVNVDSNGNIAIGDVPPSMVAMIDPEQFANGYNLNLSYVVSDFATKSYIDNKIKEVDEKATNAGDNWELINTITTTEETNLVEFTTDLEGNPFELKRIAYDCKIKGTETNAATGTLYVGLSNITHELDVPSVLRTTDTIACGFAEIVGTWADTSRGLNLIIGGTSDGKVISTNGGIENSNVLSYIRIYSSGSNAIGAGTKINVWGVRK